MWELLDRQSNITNWILRLKTVSWSILQILMLAILHDVASSSDDFEKQMWD